MIASLNGVTERGWVDFAKEMADAGARGIELNVEHIPTESHQTGAEVEQQYVDVLSAVKRAVSVPVAIKVGPYFSSFANMAHRFDQAGADALVLFNRFYQPDFDIETRTVVPSIALSTPAEVRLPLLWLSLLHRRVRASLAATTGVHGAVEAIKYPDGRRRRRHEHVCGAAAGTRVLHPDADGDDGMARAEGILLRQPIARLHEPAIGAGLGGVRAGELHQSSRELCEGTIFVLIGRHEDGLGCSARDVSPANNPLPHLLESQHGERKRQDHDPGLESDGTRSEQGVTRGGVVDQQDECELCDDPSRDQAITKDRARKQRPTSTAAEENVHDLHQHDCAQAGGRSLTVQDIVRGQGITAVPPGSKENERKGGHRRDRLEGAEEQIGADEEARRQQAILASAAAGAWPPGRAARHRAQEPEACRCRGPPRVSESLSERAGPVQMQTPDRGPAPARLR